MTIFRNFFEHSDRLFPLS
uniref:Uncharacterized protein n=1 Tax=Arundo donax TaxID=35708 RepID=A0A0A9ARX4_ARUDO